MPLLQTGLCFSVAQKNSVYLCEMLVGFFEKPVYDSMRCSFIYVEFFFIVHMRRILILKIMVE
jgi:hypothetical protein